MNSIDVRFTAVIEMSGNSMTDVLRATETLRKAGVPDYASLNTQPSIITATWTAYVDN